MIEQNDINESGFFSNLYWQLPDYHFIKNLSGEYIAVNENFCSAIGYSALAEIRGITDNNLRCDAVLMASIFKAQDQVAINKGEIRILNICTFKNGGTLPLVGTKKAYYDPLGVLSGVMSVEFDLSKSAYKKSVINILNDTRKFMQSDGQYGFYFLDDNDEKLNKLSLREAECFYHFIRGRTAREIANLLSISIRTVETHIAHIKLKLECVSKSELIARAVAEGLVFQVPSSLM